jgi:hypothetical protein
MTLGGAAYLFAVKIVLASSNNLVEINFPKISNFQTSNIAPTKQELRANHHKIM